MPKVVPQDIKDAGFFAEMFGQMDAVGFESFLQGAIDGQSALLSSRIGSNLYNTTDAANAEFVKQAEKALVVTEMWRRRITRKMGQAQSGDVSCKYEVESRDRAGEQAESWIFRLIGGDFASGVADTSHFDGQIDA